MSVSTSRSSRKARLGLIGLAGLGLLLSACDDASDQDGGGNTATLSGVAFDGPLVQGRIYLDRSEDGAYRRSFDPETRTDSDGVFELEASVAGADRTVLRVDRARDRFHGERVPITLSRELADTGDAAHISPMTTLFEVMDGDTRDSFLSNDPPEGMQRWELESYYLDFEEDALNDRDRLYLIRRGYQLQKMAEVAAAWLEERYNYEDVAGQERPPDAGIYVFRAMAENWISTIDDPFEDWLQEALAAADEKVAEAVGADPEGVDRDNGEDQIIKNLALLWKDVIGDEDTGLFGTHLLDNGAFEDGFEEQDEVAARARALEAVTRVLREDPAFDDMESIKEWVHDLGTDDFRNGDDEVFGPQLSVRCLQGKLKDQGDSAEASECSRGDPVFADDEEDFQLSDDDNQSVKLSRKDDGTYEVAVEFDEETSYSGSAKKIDDYNYAVDTEFGGQRLSGVVSKTSDDEYEFDFEGETFEWSP